MTTNNTLHNAGYAVAAFIATECDDLTEAQKTMLVRAFNAGLSQQATALKKSAEGKVSKRKKELQALVDCGLVPAMPSDETIAQTIASDYTDARDALEGSREACEKLDIVKLRSTRA